jgi:hypothetical protein
MGATTSPRIATARGGGTGHFVATAPITPVRARSAKCTEALWCAPEPRAAPPLFTPAAGVAVVRGLHHRRADPRRGGAGAGPPEGRAAMLTITNGLRERDAIETLKAQLLELLAEDPEIRDAIAALLQREDKIRRVFI